MASLALGIVGGVIGGPIGFMIGSTIGNLLFPEKSQGPRLSDLHLHTSTYGGMIPIPYGTMRVAGNIDWQTDLTEHENTSGGKGGPEVEDFTYSASFGVRLCEGPITGIGKIWANGRLIYDANNLDLGSDLPITIYLGTEDQLPDPTMEAVLGVGNVPGYRGIARVVFTDWLLTEFSNAIPNLNFEVSTVSFGDGPIEAYGLTNTSPPNEMHPYKPVITQWPLDSGQGRYTSLWDVIAGVTTTGNGVQTFDPVHTVLANTGEDTHLIQSDGWPQNIQAYAPDPFNPGFALDNRYYPVAMMMHADGSMHGYWGRDTGGDRVIADVSTGPTLATDDLDPSVYPPSGANVLLLAGVPGDEYFRTGITTANNRAMFIFTAPDTAPHAEVTKWYKMVDNQVVDHGTVDPPALVGNFGASLIGSGNRAGRISSCFENNGRYCWVHTASSTILIWSIDANKNFAYNATCGEIDLQYLDPGGVIFDNITPNADQPSIIAVGTGYCGVVRARIIAMFKRGITGGEITLADIVSDLSVRSGMDPADFDVSELTDIVKGYVVTQQRSTRESIDELRKGYFFDAVEVDDQIVFVKRGHASTVAIPNDDLAAHLDGEQPPPLLSTERQAEVELPSFISLNYVNAAADYQTGTQNAQRQVTTSKESVSIDLPISLSDAEARAIVGTHLDMAWLERDRHSIVVSRKYAQYVPTDVLTVQGRSIVIREKSETARGVIKLDGVPTLAEIFRQASVGVPGSGFRPSPSTPPGPISATQLLLLDIPLIEDTDVGHAFDVAMSGAAGASWPGASLFKSSDGGTSYASVFSESTPQVMGACSDALGVHLGGNTFDEAHTVTVVTTGGELASATELAVLNGANTCVIGAEIVQFKNAELTAENTYVLSGLLRGRRGTEWAMSHGTDERFVLLQAPRIASPLSELNLIRQYKAVTFGATVGSATAQSFANTGVALKPYAPVLLGGGVDGTGNVTLNCTRRTRIGGGWADYSDVPIAEGSEEYIWQIWNADYTQCARIISTSTPTAAYSSADQVTDFGAQQETIFFTVGQLGSAGIGTQAQGVAVGAGSGNDDPLAPISPYQSPTSGSPTPPPPANALEMVIIWGALGTGNVRALSQSYGVFDCGHIIVARFVTPSTSAVDVIGSISAGEWVDGPIPRVACLSTIPGDFSGTDLGPNSRVVSTSPTVQFSVGSNTRAFPTPELATSTTYYYNIKNDDGNGVCTCFSGDCKMFVELRKPTGL